MERMGYTTVPQLPDRFRIDENHTQSSVKTLSIHSLHSVFQAFYSRISCNRFIKRYRIFLNNLDRYIGINLKFIR